MASPPYNHSYIPSALSPPYPSNAALPQPPKRRQSELSTSGPPIKRRKGSMLSTVSNSSHPLRQTSFPPEAAANARFSRSPSLDNMSLVSGSVAGTKRKRGSGKRKSKGAADDGSMMGEKAKSMVSGDSKRKRGDRDASADDEDEGPDGDMAVQMVENTQEERQKEVEHRAMLVKAFDSEQFARYEAWRSSKLVDSTVRRVINQTLSQSVPASVTLAIKSVAKIFGGELIENARKVQTEWLEAAGELSLPSPPADFIADEDRSAEAEGSEKEKVKETRRGPLQPDHLRESLRRYRLQGEGGLVGQLGLYQVQANSGIERFGVRGRGKRLFK